MTISVTHSTPADSSFSSTGATAWNADHTLTGVGTVAEQNANAVAITGGNIDGTVIGNTTAAAGTFTTLTSTGQTSLGGAAGSESLRVLTPASVGSFFQVQGVSTGVVIRATGDTGTNSSLTSVTRGTLGHIFSTGGTTTNSQLQVSHTASAVNYVQVTGAATGSGPAITAQGSDTNASMIVRTKGTGTLFLETDGASDVRLQPRRVRTLSVNGVSSGVNYFSMTGATAGNSPEFSVGGSDTNIDLTLTPKGTGNVRFGTYTGTILTPTGYITVKDSGGTTRRLLVG